MRNPFVDLPDRNDPEPTRSSWTWATVTAVSPLRLRIDGDSAVLPVTPETLVDPSALAAGSRVWVQRHGRRLIVLGAAYPVQGANDANDANDANAGGSGR